VDGTFVSLVGVPTFLNGATIWNSGVVVEFTLQSGTSILCDGTEEKRITVVVGTTTSGGVSGSDSITEVVKLG
jgi:dihydrodipicolinate reductase